ncbi:MAG: MBL fold metallo-hydrolase [Candidatus Heimdallarchaeota archaeon]|nr:MBL fold metallo-hydrolase [Candidatus Heimdallarchaeota archaeon]
MVKENTLKLTQSIWDYTSSDTSSHTSFINLGKYLVMIDTGMNAESTKKLREFAELTTNLKFKYVIITHYHGDHTFGTKVFEDCDIISTQWTKALLTKKVENEYKDKEIILPNKTFTGEYQIKDGSRILKIIETNGHTKGSAFVYLPDEGAIITGDLLFAKMFPFAGDSTVNPYKWIDGLQKMIDLKPNIVIPGHGLISSISELKEQQELLIELVKVIEEMIDQRMSIQEIKKSKRFPKYPFDVNERWLNMTIENFYKVIKEKKEEI